MPRRRSTFSGGRACVALFALAGLILGLTACKPAPGQFLEYPTPRPSTSPWGITTGPDGNVWYAVQGNPGTSPAQPGAIVEVNPATGASTEYPVDRIPLGITSGADGRVWFSDQGRIGALDPASGHIDYYPVPSGEGSEVGLAAGPDDAVWFVETLGNRVGRVDLATHVITEYPIPVADTHPYSIAEGPDGNMWFGEGYGQHSLIGRIDPTTHTITEFPLTTGSASFTVAGGPDGNVWFTDPGIGIGKIDPTTGVIHEYPAAATPTGGAMGLSAGPDGNIWFTDFENPGTNHIGRITPDGVVTMYPVPTASSGAIQITSGPDGDLWFTEELASKVGTFALPT